jgi:hypothetical protein
MKFVITIIVILALVWALPPVRERVSTRAVPMLERLGPAGGALLSPARRMAARSQATSFARTLSRDSKEGLPLPNEQGFHNWLRQRLPDETGLDPWGNPYWMQRRNVSVTVGSNGPDGRRGTSDDVTHTVAL